MLRTLRIRDLAILEDIHLEFGPGLNVLTGETGAGKSILVDALGLVAGDRADASRVRPGAKRALVEGLLEIPPEVPLGPLLAERGVPDGDGVLLVRRELSASGGGRVFLNDSPCTLATLRLVSAGLIDLLGQSEHRVLLSREAHRDLLDRFGGHLQMVAEVRGAWDRVRELRREIRETEERSRDREERADTLRARIEEIDRVDPQPGEMESIDRERNVLRNAGRVAEEVNRAAEALYEGESSSASLAGSAVRSLDRLAELDPELGSLSGRVESARVEMEDVASLLRDYLDRTEFDPRRLEGIEQRRADLERLRLRYGRDEEEVLQARDEAAGELGRLEDLDRELRRLAASLEEAVDRYAEACRRLTAAREDAARRLAPAVENQLAELAMAKARFHAVLDRPAGQGPAEGPNGAERVEFHITANPGEGSRRVAETASGGELSRIMLALHAVVENESGAEPVRVFDEVDAGIGGAVADAVGKRLARLSTRTQVLCVTHLPQVAAYADRHYSVSKDVVDGRTRADVRALDDGNRVEELARMLGGERVTSASRKNAAELIRNAGSSREHRRRGEAPVARRGS